LAKEGKIVHDLTGHYVYLLQSDSTPERHYVGFTQNLKSRLASLRRAYGWQASHRKAAKVLLITNETQRGGCPP
jgi:predicted GIY-YIG superfamily endonuclease